MLPTTYYEYFRLNFVGFFCSLVRRKNFVWFCKMIQSVWEFFFCFRQIFLSTERKMLFQSRCQRLNQPHTQHGGGLRKITFNDCFMLFFSSEEFLFSEFISKFIYVRNQQASSSLNMFCSLERIIFWPYATTEK